MIRQSAKQKPLTFTPIAIAVFSFTSSPNLKDPLLSSLTMINGTFLDEANVGRCFVSHFGLQSAANKIAYKLNKHLANLEQSLL